VWFGPKHDDDADDADDENSRSEASSIEDNDEDKKDDVDHEKKSKKKTKRVQWKTTGTRVRFQKTEESPVARSPPILSLDNFIDKAARLYLRRALLEKTVSQVNMSKYDGFMSEEECAKKLVASLRAAVTTPTTISLEEHEKLITQPIGRLMEYINAQRLHAIGDPIIERLQIPVSRHVSVDEFVQCWTDHAKSRARFEALYDDHFLLIYDLSDVLIFVSNHARKYVEMNQTNGRLYASTLERPPRDFNFDYPSNLQSDGAGEFVNIDHCALKVRVRHLDPREPNKSRSAFVFSSRMPFTCRMHMAVEEALGLFYEPETLRRVLTLLCQAYDDLIAHWSEHYSPAFFRQNVS